MDSLWLWAILERLGWWLAGAILSAPVWLAVEWRWHVVERVLTWLARRRAVRLFLTLVG